VFSDLALGFRRTAALLVFGSVLVACGGGDTDPPVVAVEVTPSAVVVNELGAEFVLAGVGKDAGGVARITSSAGFSWASANPGIVTVDASGRAIARKVGVTVITVTANGVSTQTQVKVRDTGPRVNGIARYQDKEYGRNGYTANRPYKPIRFATIDLIDQSGRVLVTTRTDASGAYDLGPVWPNRFQIRAVAAAHPENGTQEARVEDFSGAAYAVILPATWDSTQLNISVDGTAEPAGAFNILDVIQRGFEMVNARKPGALVGLMAFWEPNSEFGTYYCQGVSGSECPRGEGIYVANGPNRQNIFDADEFDDDVIWHEFGHFVAATLSRDDSPGGAHELDIPTGDLRLAWSEGWGDYFAVAVKTWLHSQGNDAALSGAANLPTSTYVDSSANSTLYFDLAVASGEPAHRYADSELAVARILWNLDSLGYADVTFDVVTSPLMWGLSRPVSLESFWDIWRQTPAGANKLVPLTNAFLERSVDYRPDVGEPDDTLETAKVLTPGAELARTLYRADATGHFLPDKDLFSFDVAADQHVVVETLDLHNGANTRLRILDSNGALYSVKGAPLDNDDDIDSVAAKVRFVASASGRLYAEVSVSPALSPKEGRYGAYKIRMLAY